MSGQPDSSAGIDLGWALLYPPGQGRPASFHEQDLLTRLSVLITMRRPTVTVVTAAEPRAVPPLAAAIADLLSGLPDSHPRSGTPVLLIDADSDPATTAMGLERLDGPAVVLVTLTSDAPERVLRVLHIRTHAVARELPLLVLVSGPHTRRLLPELVEDAGVKVGVVKAPASPPAVREERIRTRVGELSSFHGVSFTSETVDLALSAASDPMIADQLDIAAAVAVLSGRPTVEPDDVRLDGSRPHFLLSDEGPEPSRCEPAVLAAGLAEAVQGQDAALARIAEQVCVGTRGLRMDTERPQAVLVLAGPSGTGKTTAATRLAELMRRPLLRVDLAEMTERHTISTLLGSPPGYVGSQDDEDWLTTRLRRAGDAILLFDEMEKAHPLVLTTLALGIGNGVLTDRSGRSASLRSTIVLLTTNLGADRFRDQATGFTAPRTADALADVRRTVLSDLLPEAANRVDEVVVFAPLVGDALVHVVRKALDRYAAIALGRGYRLTFTAPARRLVADLGTSSAYGARHLHRTIESLLATQLLALPPGEYVVRADRRRGALRVVGA